MKKTFYKALPLLVVIVMFALPVLAQKSNPKVPIDGGLSVLLAAGAGYGIKKIYNKKKEE
jgi:biotin transporter BioY